MMTDSASKHIAAIVIGRNEGQRLVACIGALKGQVNRIVYVDSGSTDGSLDTAKALGADIIELDLTQPFTAARARNAGRAALGQNAPPFLQFLDGDCEIRDGWLDTALAFLETNSQAAVACGRRRERFPDASIYNRLIDEEWDTPVGKTRACGGDALMRTAAFDAVGGFRENLIAGEEPELCVRFRQAGWEIHRLDAEMTWHDAAMSRFGQWWQRTKRAGHAFAEGAALHGAPPERHWIKERNRALVWGAFLPLGTLLAATAWPPAIMLLLAYPAQIFRLAQRHGIGEKSSWAHALFSVIGKFAEASGILGYFWRRVRHTEIELIEYK